MMLNFFLSVLVIAVGWVRLSGIKPMIYRRPDTMSDRRLREYVVILVVLVGVGWMFSSGLMFLRTMDAGGEVPKDWLDQPPLTDYQMRLFKAYPDARSCLPSGERAKETPNWNAFDWYTIRNDDHAMVCIYRIAEELQSPEAMAKWIKNAGLQVFGPQQHPQRGMSSNPIDLWGSLKMKGRWPLYPGWFSFARYLNKIFAWSYGFHVRYHPNGQPGSVQISYTYE